MREMRKLAVLLTILSLAGATGAAAGTRGPGGVPQIPSIPGVWSHDDLNVKIKGKWHTLTLDRGRIVQASAAQLSLREPDGSLVVVPLSPSTLFAPARFAGIPPAFRRGLHAVTMRIDGGPAVRVRLSLRA